MLRVFQAYKLSKKFALWLIRVGNFWLARDFFCSFGNFLRGVGRRLLSIDWTRLAITEILLKKMSRKIFDAYLKLEKYHINFKLLYKAF